jgi:hypothetical protein
MDPSPLIPLPSEGRGTANAPSFIVEHRTLEPYPGRGTGAQMCDARSFNLAAILCVSLRPLRSIEMSFGQCEIRGSTHLLFPRFGCRRQVRRGGRGRYRL